MAWWVLSAPKSNTSSLGVMSVKKAFSPVLSVSAIPCNILFNHVLPSTSFEEFSFSYLILSAYHRSRNKKEIKQFQVETLVLLVSTYIILLEWIVDFIYTTYRKFLFYITSFFPYFVSPQFVPYDEYQTLPWLSRPNPLKWLRWFSVGGIEADETFWYTHKYKAYKQNPCSNAVCSHWKCPHVKER